MKKLFNENLKSVHVSFHVVGGKGVSLDCPTIHKAIEEISGFAQKIKLIHISINYKNSEKKSANFDSITKAISWLNLNDNKE